MKKIIICDKNKKLIDFLKKNMIEGLQPSGITLEFIHGDVIELHEKTENSRIVTASNPQFSPDGGLDAILASKYSWEEAKEFTWNDDLFFVVSVDNDRKSTKDIIKRALVGALGYAHKFVPILTGIGTAIGGLPMQELLDGLSMILSYANLSYADLSYADLSYANLSYADLSSADLRSADLRYANLSYADLSYADLRSADLHYANLSYADLRSADLRSADLRSADLRYANLSYADLSYADNIETVYYNEGTAHFALACPEEGEFIGWKKCMNGTIVKLRIPNTAKRGSATTRKCRASRAKVLAIWDKKGNEIKETYSCYDSKFIYTVGKVAKPREEYDENRWNECGSGIHFFITKREAELYNN